MKTFADVKNFLNKDCHCDLNLDSLFSALSILDINQFIIEVGECNYFKAVRLQKVVEEEYSSIRFLYKKVDEYSSQWSISNLDLERIFYSDGNNSQINVQNNPN